MSVAVISLIALVIVFVVGTAWPINMGAIGFAACLVVGVLIGGLPVGEVLSLLPANIFVLLAGITYMFGVVHKNGTMNLVTAAMLRMVGGRVALIPWVFFLVAVVLSGVGAGPAASTAVLAPLALSTAYRAGINPLMMGIMLVHGSHGGSMAPVSVIGALVNAVARQAGLPDPTLPLFLNSLAFNIALALAAYLLFGGIGLLRRGREIVNMTEPTADAGRSGPPGGHITQNASAPGLSAYEPNRKSPNLARAARP